MVSPGKIYQIDETYAGTTTCVVNNSVDVLPAAKKDLYDAINDTAGRTSVIINEALGGQTLKPGVYSVNAPTIAAGTTLTLDAQNDPNAVFIIKVGTSLTTTSANFVVLVNDAQPQNVFWQVGDSATLGAGSYFNGTILATTSISVGTGAHVTGRLLALNGAVTLVSASFVNISSSAATYMPPSPENLTRTKANFWINYTWTNGTGNVTDSYRVRLINNSNQYWINGSAQNWTNSTVGAHNWSNISVYAYNSSGTGTLNATNVSNNTQVANNVPIQTGIGAQTVTAGNWLNFTVNATDADSDSIIYGKDTLTGSLNATTGNFTWLTNSGDVNTYSWEFNSSDGYGGLDNETITVTVNAAPTPPPPPPPTQNPTVSFTIPANLDTNVAINSAMSATFSWALNPVTVNTATFTLKQGVTPVSGVVNYTGVTATFTPSSTLEPNTTYTATITTEARDNSGNGLTGAHVWSFTTGAVPDTTPPMVTATINANGSTDVPINTQVGATFSEAMNPLTINSTTFTLKNGSTAVPGNVTYSGVTAVFTPASNLSANTTYTATITTGATDLAGNALASDYVWSWTTGAAPDTTAPMVTATLHANGSTGVPINTGIAATFTEAMDPLTITTATFTFKNGSTNVSGTVTYSLVTAVFTPASNLSVNTTYTATITTGAKDLAGNALASNYVWSWTTGATADTTAPMVTATLHANGSADVPTNTKIATTFSEAMNPLTITTATFTFKNGSTNVSGTVTYSGVTAVFTPASNLSANTTYTGTITTGAKDLAGNALASDYVWSWTTGATADSTAPIVMSTIPANLADNVAIRSSMGAIFSEALDPLTATIATFTLKQDETPVNGTVTYSGVTAVFTPASSLAANTIYTATITTGVKDLAGNALAVNKVWNFTTGITAQQGSVDLGSAGNFVILSESGITNIPTSAITGDIGTSPITGASITGLGCPEVTGTIYTVDAAGPECSVVAPVLLTAAVLDMQTAYTDAAGRTLPDATELGAGEIGGLTLAPGLYKWSSNVGISTDVTLSGNSTDVWIFQIAGKLDISNGMKVVLSGGAQAKNIFWQVADQTTLGTTSVFNGNILDQKAIVLETGAKLNGRALAQMAVTLDANTVTLPNELPVIASLSPLSVVQYTTTQLTVTASDHEGQPLFYAWDFNNDGDFEIGRSTSNIISHTFSVSGVNTIRVHVDDGVESTEQAFSITVTPATIPSGNNNDPVITSVSPVVVNTVGLSTLTLTATDADAGTTLYYAWDINGDGVFESGRSIVNTISTTIDSTRVINVRVDDGIRVTTQAVTIAASSTGTNTVPVFNSSATTPKTATVNVPTTFTLSATDSDSFPNAISYMVDADNSGTYDKVFVGSTSTDRSTINQVSITFTTTGTKVVPVRVDDGVGITTSYFTVVVS